MIKAAHICYIALALVLAMSGCSSSNAVQDYERDKARMAAKSGATDPAHRVLATPAGPRDTLTDIRDASRPASPPPYFGPNAIGTGTPNAPSPNAPFVDSAASCASILDADARQLCLQRAGQR
jgi:hypothetical protein